MARLVLDNVIKTYGDLEVVHGISLAVEDGEFVVLVGPSGCGKSTVLRMIAGLETITAGRIHVGERVINDIAPQHRNLAMVFQNYALYPHKTVRENIIFGLKKAKLDKAEIGKRLHAAAAALQLEPYLDRKPAALSGGQRQRVAMGRAIVRDVDMFLFDEPLSNLDAKLRHEMRTEIRRLHKRYFTTSVYVTHDQVEAMTLADKVVVMRDGRIEQVGKPMDIYLEPANIFTATFIGAPSMNILNGILRSDHLQIGDQQIRLSDQCKRRTAGILAGRPDGRPVRLGIRPEFLEDARLTVFKPDTIHFAKCAVELVEPLGFHRDITAQFAGKSLLARLDLRSAVGEGHQIDFAVDLSRAHFFDPETGARLAQHV